jgi:hypothetical protein
MDCKSDTKKSISRRRILPILGSFMFIPFLGFGNPKKKNLSSIANNEEYQTLLKPDGTAVKVKVSAIKNSKVIKKNVSNKSFLEWLGRKL